MASPNQGRQQHPAPSLFTFTPKPFLGLWPKASTLLEAAVLRFLQLDTTMVHNGAMRETDKVRQSVTLPGKVARQVRSMARSRRLSASRMLVELVEEGIEARKEKEKAFFDLAERFRAATNPDEVERLGNQLGRMVFGA